MKFKYLSRHLGTILTFNLKLPPCTLISSQIFHCFFKQMIPENIAICLKDKKFYIMKIKINDIHLKTTVGIVPINFNYHPFLYFIGR